MTHIYIDESGDLGFNPQGSKYFIITCVKLNDERTHLLFKRIPRKVRQRQLNKKTKKLPELKFSNSSPLIRECFLSRVAKLPVDIFTLVIDKRYTQRNLQENLPILYNYLIKTILEKAFTDLNRKQQLTICLDRCMSFSQRQNFELYVKTVFLSLFQELPHLQIDHESSQNNECLQVVDFICGAFGYKYNTSNLSNDFERYTTLIQQIIQVERTDLFKGDTQEKATHTY